MSGRRQTQFRLGAIALTTVLCLTSGRSMAEDPPASPTPVRVKVVPKATVDAPPATAATTPPPTPPTPVRKPVPRVFVRPFTDAAQLGAQQAETYTTLAATALSRGGTYETVTEADLKGVLATDALRQVLGCEDASCVRSLGDAVKTEWLLSGTLGRTGTDQTLTLALLDVATTRPVARVQRGIPRGVNTAAAVDRLVDELVAKVNGDPLAELTFSSDPAGATVLLDGVILGETPLPPVAVRPGTHEVVVQKAEYVSGRVDVMLLAGDTRTEIVTLVPVARQM